MLTDFEPSQAHRRGIVVAVLLACCVAQAGVGSARASAGAGSTLATLDALRDTFIGRIRANGLVCPIAPPTIVVDHVPSFGQYDEDANVLHTADWDALSAEEHGLFQRLAGPGADETAVHAVFEDAAHNWIFVHELGHWWQACRKANASHSNYQIEYGANRIALAYWREYDPTVAARMLAIFNDFVSNVPSPVPAGEAAEPYFNSHYQQLGPTPAYRWYQSHMVVTAGQERPVPRFATALADTKP